MHGGLVGGGGELSRGQEVTAEVKRDGGGGVTTDQRRQTRERKVNSSG